LKFHQHPFVERSKTEQQYLRYTLLIRLLFALWIFTYHDFLFFFNLVWISTVTVIYINTIIPINSNINYINTICYLLAIFILLHFVQKFISGNSKRIRISDWCWCVCASMQVIYTLKLQSTICMLSTQFRCSICLF